MLRPFPSAIHIGTDICQVSRIRSLIASRHGLRFIDRVFSPAEREAYAVRLAPAYRLARAAAAATVDVTEDADMRVAAATQAPISHPELSEPTVGNNAQLESAVRLVAGRFAAKEAAFKAHPLHHLGFHDVHILPRHAAHGPAPESASTSTPTSKAAAAAALARATASPAPCAVVQPVPPYTTCAQEARISISHDGDYATAVCLGFVPE
ncbi:hypothetical protein BROUX41_006496 [Berkeleyomyces rouxiae]|uniref:uncharacterized protein n=1 Tax=Berkeleyomyces rouxiae TaxID=2035830 RepID=UPI003B7D43E9